MPSTGVFELSAGTVIHGPDVLPFVDTTDTTQSPEGSLLKITMANFFAAVPVPIGIVSANAFALAVGLTGATNPALQVDASTASSATGIKIKSAAATAGVALSVVSSGTNENLTIDAKGSGTIVIGGSSTGGITLTRAVSAPAGVTGALTGNASTATALQTARTINGVSFDGTANITIKATATSALTIGTHLTGSSYDGSSPVTIATDAVSTNSASTLMARDSSGNFAAGAASLLNVQLVQAGGASGDALRAWFGSGANLPFNIGVNRGNGDAWIGWNAVQSSGNAQNYDVSNVATRIRGNTGFLVQVTAMGTAGNPITWIDALSIDNTGAVTITGAATFGSTTSLHGVVYTWPGSAGTSGYVLSTDGSGNLSWIAQTGGGGGGATLTIGAHLTGGSYDGSTGVTIASDAVSTNTASKTVSRDSSGNFAAGQVSVTSLISTGLGGPIFLGGTSATDVQLNGGSHLLTVNKGDGSALADLTAGIITGNSLVITGTSLSINGVGYNWPSGAPTAGNVLTSLIGGVLEWVNVDAGSLGGTTLATTVVTSSLTTVGTIGTGTWQGTSVKTGFGGTGLTSYTAGDLAYYASGTAFTKLAIGSAAQFLNVNGGGTAPQWHTLVAADVTDLATAALTFTNKRVTSRTGSTTSSATPTINTDNLDRFSITTLNVNITSMTTNLSGSPTAGQRFELSIVDGGGAQTIAWGTGWENGSLTLPTTTPGGGGSGGRLDMVFIWNDAANKWTLISVATAQATGTSPVVWSAPTQARLVPRTGTTTSSATPTINTDTVDNYDITALSTAITSMTTNLSGTPTTDQTLWISFTDNGTARAITWGTSFEASTVALPTTTVISTRLDVGFVWNAVTTKWRCVAVA